MKGLYFIEQFCIIGLIFSKYGVKPNSSECDQDLGISYAHKHTLKVKYDVFFEVFFYWLYNHKNEVYLLLLSQKNIYWIENLQSCPFLFPAMLLRISGCG